MTYEEFLEQYQPIENKWVEDASYDGLMFEIDGPEYAAVTEANRIDPRCVWTLLACDGTMSITPGLRFVNRFGYFVTVRPFKGVDCEVILSEDENEEEDEEEEGYV